jgi:hypothetical protein
MLPMVISIGKHIKKSGKAPVGLSQNLILFINMVINMPMWYILTTKELFSRKK